MVISRSESIKMQLREQLSDKELDDTVDLFESQMLDSLSLIELVTFLEEKFAIEVFIEDITKENFRSLNTIADYVNTKLEENISSI